MERRVLGIVTIVGLAVALSNVPSAYADAERPLSRQEVYAQVLSEIGSQGIEAYRAQWTQVASDLRAAGLATGAGELPSVTRALELIEQMPQEDLAFLSRSVSGADLSRLLAAMGQVPLRAPTLSPQGEIVAGTLPGAPYPSCGSVRDGDWFVIRLVLDIAKGIWSAASRLCDQTVFGANTSVVCIVIDLVLFAAETVYEQVVACDGDIDSAEIEGSYLRLEHIHIDLEGSVTNDNTNTANIIANDNTNTANIIANDNTNTANIIVNDNTNTANIIANDNANTASIIANDNANRDAILANAAAIAEAAIDRQIQDNLDAGRCEAWMYTPKYLDVTQTLLLGGYLEQVVASVQRIIDHGRVLRSAKTADLDDAQKHLDLVLPVAAARPPLQAKSICVELNKAYKSAVVK